jgi:hypothetical protein
MRGLYQIEFLGFLGSSEFLGVSRELTGGESGCIVVAMGKTAEKTERDQEVVRDILRDLEARSQEPMTWDEAMSYIRRMPKMPAGWTSADIIREYRGPLPDYDHRDDRR